MKKNIFAVLGGDLRQVFLINALLKEGFEVRVAGINKNVEIDEAAILSSNPKFAVVGADIVILPLPYTNDEVNLNAIFSDAPIELNQLYESLKGAKLVLAGKVTDSIKYASQKYGFKVIDYLDREEFQILNAIPTVEGAIHIAMSEVPFTIHGSNCLVIGYGRIGKLLSHMLSLLGANVSVSARKCSDLAWIKTNRLTGIFVNDIAEGIHSYDIIFNTVPSMMLSKNELIRTKDDVLIIDLASKPGGVDLNFARELNKRVIWALSLPGKVAPKTAGEIIKDTIFNIIREEEIE